MLDQQPRTWDLEDAMPIIEVDFMGLTATHKVVRLDFTDSDHGTHIKTYDAEVFAAALPMLTDRSIDTRLEGFRRLGMSFTDGRERMLVLTFNDGSIGNMGVLSEHGPVSHLELLLHPQSGHDQGLLSVLEKRASLDFFLENTYLSSS